MQITENTKFTFGKHRGVKLRDVPDAYLKWILENLSGGDFHNWATAAKEEQARRKKDDTSGDLEAQADALLRRAGLDPRSCRY
jgi:hypothetical protein